MVFENDIIERRIERQCVNKDIIFDDIRLDFFYASCDDEKASNNNYNSENTTKFTSRITEKSEFSEDTSSEFHDQEKNQSESQEVRSETDETNGDTRR